MAQEDFSLLLSAFPKAATGEPAKTVGGEGSVTDIINAAAEKEGVPPELMQRIAGSESGGKADARNQTGSSAKGLFQFIDSTWKSMGGKPGEQTDPVKNAELGARYIKQNVESLRTSLGRNPTYGEVYAAHFFGAGVAPMLKDANPTERIEQGLARFESRERVAQILQQNPNLRGKTVGQVLSSLESKMGGGTMGGESTQPSFSNVRPLATDRTAMEAVTDNLAGAASGVVQGAKLIADAFGANNAVSGALGDASKAIMGTQSQYRKDQRTERNMAIKGAEASGSTWEEIKANVGGFVEAPIETTLNALGTSAPTLLMSVIPGLGQAQAARLILQGAMGATQGAGAAKGSIYEAVRDQLVASGMSKDDAEKAAAGAQAYDGQNGGAIAANAILGSLAGTSGIESAAGRIAGRKVGDQATRGVMGRAGVGIAKEAPVEGVQGGGERVTSNVALQNEGFDVPTFQGAAGQAVAEGLASAPGGAVFGALDRSGAQTPPPPPNPLQSVVDQAQKPGSVLSRAVVATGATEQPATPPAGAAPVIDPVDQASTPGGAPAPLEMGNTTGLAGPGPSSDPFAKKAAELEGIIRSQDLVRSIRSDGAGLPGIMFDLSTMRDPNAREDIKEQARQRVEEEISWAQTNYAPKPAMDTVAGTPGFEPAGQGRTPREPKREDVMGLEIVQATLRDPDIGPKIGPTDRQNVLQLTATAQNPGLPLATRQQAAEQAIEIVGRYRAGANQDAAPQSPALLEKPAPVTPDVASPAEQQTVAPATPVANETAASTQVPAVNRQRATMLRQLVDNGFETVKRENNDFYLINSTTGQRFKLDGMADAQIARNQIRLSVDEKANTAAASPLNDRAEPTQAQINAGNYKKSDVIDLNGMKIKIENPKGSIRRGTSPDGVMWETKMAHHYGEFQGTVGADGDKLDVFLGPRTDNDKVFVIDQVNEDGSFDEHKVMMGFGTEEEARAGYLANYEKGWTGLGAITEMPLAEFKDWSKSRAAKKPLADLPKKAAAPTVAKTAENAPSQKARWIKALLDNSRLAGDTGIQIDVTPDGKLTFLGNPDSSKQGRSLVATLAEARQAGATDKEIADAIRASKEPKPAKPATPEKQGQFATLEDAKTYLSQQRRASGTVSGLPLQMADGSFGIAAKGTPQYAEAERQRDEREGANKQVDGKGQGTLFTVKDGGKTRSLKKVSKGSMPKKSSARREGKSLLRTLSQDEASAIEQMAAILGKKVAFYEVADNGGRLADGFVNPGEPNVIYVATETTVNPVAIFGHEFYHTLRETNPAAWNAIAAVVRKRVKDAKGFREDYYGEEAAKERGDAELDMEQGGELEELISDLGGNLMMDASFWRDVFAQIQKDNGKDAKGIIARLAAAIEQMVARVMAAINQGGYDANDFVDDMDAIRAEFAKALAGHIQKAGVSKSAMDAEIKKSVIRVSAEQKALQEFAEVDAQYRGTEQWMKAPNGQPTQLSERQWIQVRTPSFKAWFGDWEAFAAKQGGVWNDDKGEVSKAVDDNGEPLVVYHGTTKGGFSEFKTPGGERRGDLGIFTTPNLEMAKTYNKRGRSSEIQFENMDRDALEGGDTPGYYASFVNIRNPYETDFEGAYWNGERPAQYVVMLDGEMQFTPTGNGYFKMFEDADTFARENGGKVEPAPDHWETTDSAVREARGNRNDGAIIRSVVDDGGGYSNYIAEPSDVFVALDPNQLKSATQNTGEFGKRTDDMRFSRDRAASDIDPDGYNEFTATPEDVALADAYEAKHGIRPYLTAGQLQVPVKLPNIRKSVKREHSKKNLEKGYIYHPIFGVPLNKNGTVTLYYPTTNEDARRVARERTLKAPPGSNRVYLTNESAADVVAAKPGNISILGDDIQANVLIQVDPSLLQMDTEHADGRIDFFIPIAEGDAFKGKMSQVKLFNMFAERAEPITREKTLKDIERSIEDAMNRIDKMPESERKKLVAKAKAVLKQEHNVGTLLSENGKLQKTRAGEYDLKHYEGDSVASLGLGLASAQQITEKLSSCPQHANCESLCLGDTSGQNLLYGGEGPFRAGPRLSQYLKTEAMVLHPEEFALVLHHEIKLLENWARKETGFETTKDEETGETIKTPKQLYQPSIRLNVTSDFRPVTWAPVIKAMPGVEFYDYTKLDTKPISKNHHLTYSSDGVAQVVDGVAIGNGNYNWDRMLRQMRNGFNVAMAFSDKNDMPKFLVDGSTGERFQVWNGDNYDARFLDPKPGQEGNLFNKGMIIGLTNKDRTKSGLAIMLEKQGPASATKAEWKKLINDIASDERFINDKSVPYVLKWVSNQKGQIGRSELIEFADSPAVKHNGFFMDYNPKRDGDTVVVADQERTKEAYKAQQPKVFEVTRFSRDRNSDTYNQRIDALKDLISCLKK